MKKVFILFLFLFLCMQQYLSAQPVTERLRNAWQRFTGDSQLKHAMASLYVIDAVTGEVVFDRNSQTGLAPASTQKIITSITALELLGPAYRYTTEIGAYEENGIPYIVVLPSGDPTFGSNRYQQTKPGHILDTFYRIVKKNGYNPAAVRFMVDSTGFETNLIPDGWVWQDMGNYYGAGAGPLMWRENQFAISFKTANQPGTSAVITAFNDSSRIPVAFINEVTAGPKGSGDNAYIYLPVGQADYRIRGTVPAGENSFTISGAVYNGTAYWANETSAFVSNKSGSGIAGNIPVIYRKKPAATRIIHRFISPSLDAVIYWFNKKSINLYGEALLRTIGRSQTGYAGADSGLAVLRRFWKAQQLDPDELNMYDGSGLSPLNRITTHAQVAVLKYARSRPWFPYFYTALPEYNGMKMKSGTISDVKGYCGYHKAGNGREYIFSLLVNNYSGRASQLVNKMFVLLNQLK